MNVFDAVICLLATVAALFGFKIGLLRSLAIILGYVSAMPVAIAIAAKLSVFAVTPDPTWADNPTVLFAIFLATGALFGALLRVAVNEIVGADVPMVDRLAGATLGVVRIGLVAMTLVLIFDRLIPADRQPAFLSGSRLRPILAVAAASGLKSLPPEVADSLDRLKNSAGL